MNPIPSSLRSLRVLVAGSLLGLAAVAVAGCASDYITYSQEYRTKGIEYYQQGNYTDAASAFRNAVHQMPPDYTSHYYLGACLAQLGDYQQAIQQYKTCLQIMDVTIEGKHDDAIRGKAIDGLASAVAKSENPSDEIAQLNAQPKTVQNQWIIAKIDRNVGDADSGIEAYRAALLLDPRNFTIAKEFGLYLQQLGQINLARDVLRRANGLNQQDDQVAIALRDCGGVPGPANKDEADLAKPIIPQGPIPPVDVTKIRLQNPFTTSDQNTSSNNTNTNSAADASATTPKD
ncbi:MAG TPA: tetratricopeptide repeat protein [Tepidisphaeraceae bacterium]|nr:tetratricopeptide repeat protein [Tepidisphaeraceae bacterium]